MNYRDKIKQLRELLAKDLLEKDEAIALGLLCMIARKSIFFYGPPGTAKSLVARRISCAFQSNKFFDYLMNRFSTPEEIFGPLKLSELRKDRLIREIEGYLPSADFAFLDEIWKSSPAVLNSLLTIINEKKFRNGEMLKSVPLKGLIAASNELPQKGQSLEALYDRFIMRLVVSRLEKKESFRELLQTTSLSAEVQIPDNLKFSNEELESIHKKSKEIKIEDSVLNILENLRNRIEAYNANALQTNNPIIDVSERRYIAIMELLRVAAVLSDRQNVALGDLLLLKHCLWSEENQKEEIEKMLYEVIESNNPKFVYDTQEYENLKKEVTLALTEQENIYDIKELNNAQYLVFEIKVPMQDRQEQQIILYVNVAHMSDGKRYKCIFRPSNTSLMASLLFAATKANIYDNVRNMLNNNEFIEINQMLYQLNTDTCDFFINSNTKQLGWNATWFDTEQYEFYQTLPIPMKVKKGDSKPIRPNIQKTYQKECNQILQELNIEKQKYQDLQKDFMAKNFNSFVVNETEYEIYTKDFKQSEDSIEQIIIQVEKLKNDIDNAKLTNVFSSVIKVLHEYTKSP